MTIPTTSWSEVTPAGSDDISQGDNRVRELKTQIREVIAADHKFESSGQDADNGKHSQVSLIEQADIGTGADGLPILGAQIISSVPELVYTTEGDEDIQLTQGAGQYYGAPVAVSGMTGIMNLIYPIGFVITLGVATNPGTLLGVGTWTAVVGAVIVGKDASGTFDTLDATGGAETHTLSIDEMPAHTHTYEVGGDFNSDITIAGEGDSTDPSKGTPETSSTGSGSAHNILQPYIVKYVWQRTS